MQDTVTDRIRTIVAAVLSLPEDEVTAEASAATLADWDSLATIKIVMAVEGEFGVEFNEEIIPRLLSIEALCRNLAAMAPQ